MNSKKIDLLSRNYFRSQKEMAEAMGLSPTRISAFISGTTKELSSNAVLKLIVDHRIDPDWLVSPDDEPIRFREKSVPVTKYNEVIEKLTVVQEELIEYQKQKIKNKE